MSHSIAIPRNRGAETGGVRVVHVFVIVSAVLGMLVGALGFPVAESAMGFVRGVLTLEATVAETTIKDPEPNLPNEWTWQRAPVEFERMYSDKRPVRVDWIRENGGR